MRLVRLNIQLTECSPRKTTVVSSAAARIDTQGVLPADTRHREISDFGQAGEGICTIHLPPGKPEIQ